MANAVATAAVASNVARTHKRKNAFSKTLQSTSKQLIWLFSINGILWIWCSYILAWFDKVQIAESLSSNVCSVIIGQTLGYFITASVKNIFRYNPKLGGQSTYPGDTPSVSEPTDPTL